MHSCTKHTDESEFYVKCIGSNVNINITIIVLDSVQCACMSGPPDTWKSWGIRNMLKVKEVIPNKAASEIIQFFFLHLYIATDV